jgi:hypothetical protein
MKEGTADGTRESQQGRRGQVRVVEEQLQLPLVGVLVDIRADMMAVVVAAGMKSSTRCLKRTGCECAGRSVRVLLAATWFAAAPSMANWCSAAVASVGRSRARRVEGGEVRLPSYETLRAEDPLHERAVERMEAEKTWWRLMGKADLPKLVTALRRLDIARAADGNEACRVASR